MCMSSRRLTSQLAVIAAVGVGLAGCAALPRSGPDDQAIRSNATATLTTASNAPMLAYALVDLVPAVLQFVEPENPGSIFATFGGGRGAAPQIRVGIGDVVQVTIFESAAGGLFIPMEAGVRPGNFVNLPEQTVDQSGNITVPYAGAVPAAGRTVSTIEADIVERLAPRAIEPQAVVALVDQRATEASVLGEVNAPGTFPVNPAGDRVLDMISRAGGLKYQGFESNVTLQRSGRDGTVYFNTLLRNPAENIYVAPGDVVYVQREQRSFLAFGASGASGQFIFDTDKISLGEAVGKAGGLLDDRADPGQVFLYRIVDRAPLERIGVDLSGFPPDQQRIPTIFRSNFRRPTEYFIAQGMRIQDKDIVYVSNADSVELYKFLDLISSVSITAGEIALDTLLVKDAVGAF